MSKQSETWMREAEKLTPAGYTDEEWARHTRMTEECRRGLRETPPPVRIHLPDGRLHFTMEWVDGVWRRIDPPEPVEVPTPPRDTPCFVYFIGAEKGPVKIGVAVSPQSRLRTLQNGNPTRLSILATRDGSFEEEKAYHAKFAKHRLQGEWFKRSPSILAEIERLRKAARC